MSVGILTGVLYAWSWLLFIRYYSQNKTWRFIISIIVLTAPLIQFFYRHIETYALTFLLIQWWLFLWLVYFKNRNDKLLIILFFLGLLCYRTHPTSILLLLIWFLTLLYHLSDKFKVLAKLFTWKRILYFVFIPVIVVGLYVYFIN